MTELRDLTPHAAIPLEQSSRDRRQRRRVREYLPEMASLERMLAEAPEQVRTSVIERISLKEVNLPVYRVDIGSEAPDAPLLLLVGGVHGLERIGTQVLLAWLQSLLKRTVNCRYCCRGYGLRCCQYSIRAACFSTSVVTPTALI